ncbi:MAG: hypothetical protein L0K86_11525 [Actinomycetia bacterium]|nr:hypothetical protein [Actinomycetes bacterium]
MTESPRPQKVTMACLLAGIGSLIVLISTATMLADWAPSEVQSEVESMIEQPPLDTYNLGLDQVLEWMRLAMMAVAAGSVAAVILAIYAARRHKGSRIALTIVSATSSLLFVASGLAGLLPAAMAIACIVLLGSRDGNDWFNPDRARKRAEAAERAGVGASSGSTSASVTPAPSAPQAPSASGAPQAPPVSEHARPADVPFGTAPEAGARQPYAGAQPPMPRPAPPAKLPGTVLAAVLTATIMAGMVALAGLVVLAGYATAPTDLGAELLDNPALENNPQLDSLGWSTETLGEVVVYSMAGLLVLALVAIGAALWMLRRSNAARIVLVVLSGVTIALSVVATIVGIPWIAAAIAVIVLVFRPSSNDYFRRSEQARQ